MAKRTNRQTTRLGTSWSACGVSGPRASGRDKARANGAGTRVGYWVELCLVWAKCVRPPAALYPNLRGFPLTVLQALLGFERNLTHLDGRTITVKRSGTTQPGEVEVVEGEGVRLCSFQGLSVDECRALTGSQDARMAGRPRWRYVYRVLGRLAHKNFGDESGE